MLFFVAYWLSACLVHEAGHFFAARLLSVRVKRFGICWRGFYVVRDPGCPFDNMLISFWGPLMNFVMAMLLWGDHMGVMANVIVGAVNLLPIRNSDGDRILDCVAQL